MPCLRIFPLVVLAAACSSCETLTPLPDFGYPPPEKIVEVYRAWESSVSSLEGEARVRIDSPAREGSLKATILVSKPHRFRMVAYPPVGGTVFEISIVRDLMRFHVPSEEKIYERSLGAAGGEGKGDVNEIFSQAGLASIILGRSGTDGNHGMKMIDRDDRIVKFGLFDENGLKTEEVHLQECTLFKLRHLTFGKGGLVMLDVAYGGYEKRGDAGIWWPSSIVIECPTRKFKLAMDFNEIELNGEIPPEAFEIEVSESTKVIRE